MCDDRAFSSRHRNRQSLVHHPPFLPFLPRFVSLVFSELLKLSSFNCNFKIRKFQIVSNSVVISDKWRHLYLRISFEQTKRSCHRQSLLHDEPFSLSTPTHYYYYINYSYYYFSGLPPTTTTSLDSFPLYLTRLPPTHATLSQLILHESIPLSSHASHLWDQNYFFVNCYQMLLLRSFECEEQKFLSPDYSSFLMRTSQLGLAKRKHFLEWLWYHSFVTIGKF